MTYPRTPERKAKIRRVLACRQHDLALVMANIHDPHNVSAIYRSCDAFGVPVVHQYYTRTAFPHLGEKSSASARKWVASVRHSAPGDLMAALRAKGMKVYATSCSPAAKPVAEYDLTGPVAVIMGNEHSGVDAELLPLVDGELYIPMYGMIQSFNVSVAAALILSEASRQRALAGKYDAPTCPPDELEEMVQAWLKK
ncbi:tRNA guanosine-2'-O-methyltransferase [uncultured delta proteobacterium]|uniref:tRNA (guanosine(18)-2'-O)-methyltransferase n=1 Tax=uncultured delta proteobacterium TaxID=34034 RepID=A0A212J9Y7_9DELT|nr:tRNA guanosine-2'-O-methyltransferase [uncultured delta proteobacterium]